MQLKGWRAKGYFTEERFEDHCHPVDTDSNHIDHPLSTAFARQHHRQRATDMTNAQVIGDFEAAFTAADPSAVVQENLIVVRADTIWWCDQTLSANKKY